MSDRDWIELLDQLSAGAPTDLTKRIFLAMEAEEDERVSRLIRLALTPKKEEPRIVFNRQDEKFLKMLHIATTN